MLRVAVIGMGPIGNMHARVYQNDPLAQLVGVCDKDRQRADAAAGKYSVPKFQDAAEMLAGLKPHGVSVTTRGYAECSDHYEPTMQAIAAGCHVLGEKPISNEISKAEE